MRVLKAEAFFQPDALAPLIEHRPRRANPRMNQEDLDSFFRDVEDGHWSVWRSRTELALSANVATTPLRLADEDSRHTIAPATYEVRLLDTDGVPIAGVPVLIETTVGGEAVTTAEDGTARLQGSEAGSGTARLLDTEALCSALSGRRSKTRGPAKTSEGSVATTARGLLTGVSVRSGAPLDTILQVEVDLLFTPGPRTDFELASSRGDLSTLESGLVSTLRMRAVGSGAPAIVLDATAATLVPPPPLPFPPPGPPVWSSPNLYHVQPGDFLAKIARTWLGEEARWPELWALNKPRFPGRSPDSLFVGDTLVMPPDAVPPFVTLPSAPEQQPSPPPTPPPPFMNVNVEDIANALAEQEFEAVFDFLASIPSMPPPSPPLDLGEGAEEAMFSANMLALALQGEVDTLPSDEAQV